MANDTLHSAEMLLHSVELLQNRPRRHRIIRSALSRYYYASYQAGTAYLLYRGQLPPGNREAWTHGDTPGMLIHNLGTAIRSEDTKRDIARKLRGLYKKRCEADYVSSLSQTHQDLIDVAKTSRYLVKTILALLSE